MMFNSHGVRDNTYERSGHRDLDKEVGVAEGYHEGNVCPCETLVWVVFLIIC